MSHPVDKGFTRISSYPHDDGWVVKIPISQGYRIERRWFYGVCSICGYQNSLAKLRSMAGEPDDRASHFSVGRDYLAVTNG